MKDGGILGGLHPFLKLLLLALLMLGSTLVVLIVGFIIAYPFIGDEMLSGLGAGDMSINSLRYVQILSHLGLFIISAAGFGILVGGKPARYFRAAKRPLGLSVLISAVIMVAAVPMVNFLLEVNQDLSLPESMKGLEQWMRQSEEAAEHMTKILLDVSTPWGLLFNIFMIAVIPALGEEFIFRGAIQRIFRQWTGNVHIAVFIAAVLFSSMHMQFYGFLPRLMLGMVLGYMLVVTGNIWIPVFAHFFNNAMAVIFFYLVHNELTGFEVENVGTGSIAPYAAAVSMFFVILLFRYMRRVET